MMSKNNNYKFGEEVLQTRTLLWRNFRFDVALWYSSTNLRWNNTLGSMFESLKLSTLQQKF